MSLVFIILAIMFIVVAVIWTTKWNKVEEQPHIYTPQNGGAVGNGGENPSSQPLKARPEFKITKVGYGRDGWFKFDGTYFFADYGQNAILFLEIQAKKLEGVVNIVKHAGNKFPAIQFGCVTNPTPCYEVCDIQNEKRQTLNSRVIIEGETLYLACPILIHQNEKDKYYSVTLRYRVDNGNGWGEWENTDAISIHKL